jgi:hypothetical protein
MKKRTLYWLVVFMLVVTGCKKSSDSSDEDTKDVQENPDEPQTGAIAVSTIKDLNLSSALNITVPESVQAKGSGVEVNETGQLAIDSAYLTSFLATRKKSQEACLIRSKVKETLDMMKGIAQELCYVEADSGSAGFGKKYYMDGEDEVGNPMTFEFWADNSKKDELTFYFCENQKLQAKVKITGVAKDKLKGSFIAVGAQDVEGDMISYASTGEFDDKYTDEKRTVMSLQSSFWGVMEGEDFVYRDRVFLNLAESQISTVKYSSSGNMPYGGEGTSSFEETGTAKVGPNIGGALLFNSGFGFEEVAASSYSYKAYFDNAGTILDKDASTQFSETGALFVKDSDLLKPIDEATYQNPTYESSDWDCTGAVLLESEVDEEKLIKCDEMTPAFDEENCYDPALYSYSDPYDINQDEFVEEAIIYDGFDYEEYQE